MLKIFIFCILLLACNDNDVQENKQLRNTRPVPGLVTSPRIVIRKKSQKCIPEDTSFVVNSALCK